MNNRNSLNEWVKNTRKAVQKLAPVYFDKSGKIDVINAPIVELGPRRGSDGAISLMENSNDDDPCSPVALGKLRRY